MELLVSRPTIIGITFNYRLQKYCIHRGLWPNGKVVHSYIIAELNK